MNSIRDLCGSEAIVGAQEVALRRAPLNFGLCNDTLNGIDQALGPADLEHVSTLLFALSFLLPPIYVGMARGEDGLRGRLRAHVSVGLTEEERKGTLGGRLSSALGEAKYLRRCTALYVPLKVEGAAAATTARLLEHVLIRVLRPSESKRG